MIIGDLKTPSHVAEIRCPHLILESNCAMALKFRMIIGATYILSKNIFIFGKIIQKVSSIVIKTMPIDMAFYTL